MAIRSIEDYVQCQTPPVGRIINALRELIQRVSPETRGYIKWAQPVYDSGGPMCFIKATKKNVTFGFWRGAALTDPDSLLSGTGRSMRNVVITEVSEIPEAALTDFIQQAIRLNQELGDPTEGLTE